MHSDIILNYFNREVDVMHLNAVVTLIERIT